MTPAKLNDSVVELLRFLYGDRAPQVAQALEKIVHRHLPALAGQSRPELSHRDAVLITYADQVQQDEFLRQVPSLCPCTEFRHSPKRPLQVLREFLLSWKLQQCITTVHLLPFFPYSSDDGFSVVDYRQVHPELGSWEDIRALGRDFQLMFDLVLNHVSRHSRYFQGYLRGEEPYRRFFLEVDPGEDLSGVVRPRSTPLLTPVETTAGRRWVWTTFSADQVDLNYHEPAVLLEMLDVLLFYLAQGVRIVRLDAIAYLWKELGTACIHLPQTHAVVKLIRALVDQVAPGTLVLTETNVPHRENISYFGQGDEAHLIYQFSLPPLLLDAVVHQDPGPLREFLSQLEEPPQGCTFFNFTASHDGIGVRPLEGLVSSDRFERLLQAAGERGGLISTRRTSQGTDAPYELNITYYDAVAPRPYDPQEHLRRFLLTQGMMLSLQGVPGIYFHSLVGTPNYYQGVRERGVARAINRRKYGLKELQGMLHDPAHRAQAVLHGYLHLLRTRSQLAGFSPWAPQRVVQLGHKTVVALERGPEEHPQVLVLANFSDQAVEVDLPGWWARRAWHDELKDQQGQGPVPLGPWQLRWLRPSSPP